MNYWLLSSRAWNAQLIKQLIKARYTKSFICFGSQYTKGMQLKMMITEVPPNIKCIGALACSKANMGWSKGGMGVIVIWWTVNAWTMMWTGQDPAHLNVPVEIAYYIATSLNRYSSVLYAQLNWSSRIWTEWKIIYHINNVRYRL